MKPFMGFDSEAVSLTNREKTALLRRHALHCKYEKAVELYAETDMSLVAIAAACNVSLGGLGKYLRRYWRELVLRRNRIPADGTQPDTIKIKAVGQQNINAHAKYKEAVAACDSLDYIDLNLSQVARKFGVDGASLANFMRIHYEDTLIWREKLRHRLGIHDNAWRGARPESVEQYAEAVNLYTTTNRTIPEIADRCEVSMSGLMQHLRFYHKELLKQKRGQRKAAVNSGKVLGDLMGNGRTYGPSQRTEQKYAEALALYRDTALTMKEIVLRTNVSAEGFRFYLHKWHKELVCERAGIDLQDAHTDFRSARQRMKTVTAKYEKAIQSLKDNPRPVALVATEFGLHPEVFREYLHKHEPVLAQQQGRMVTASGKKVLRRSEEKYAEAIRLYKTTTESLKSITQRLGLNYKSVGGYIRRNYPELLRKQRNN